MQIHYYQNADIDFSLWDKCIHNAINPNIYGLSWYLNIVSPEWHGLLTEDYKAVMPLPLTRKLGKLILVQPPFCWQLGIFSSEILDISLVETFLLNIPGKIKINRYNFNKFNTLPVGKYKIKSACTAELELISSYEKIRSSYSRFADDKIITAQQSKIGIVKSIANHDFLQFAFKFDQFNRNRLKPSQVSFLRQIVSNSIRYRMGEIYGAYSRENNLCATVFFIKYRDKRIIHYMAADQEGILSGALYLILDRYIYSNAEKNLILSADDPGNSRLIECISSLGGKPYAFASIKKLIYL